MTMEKSRRRRLSTEVWIVMNALNFQIKPEILTRLSTNQKMNTMVKMIYQSCLIQKNREDVEFDSFDNYFDKSQLFKNSLLCFANVDNQFSLCCSLHCFVLHCKLNGQNVELESAEKVLGTYFFIELKKIEKSTMLRPFYF